MKKILFLIAIVLLATEALWAAHIDENRAREIARAFFSAKATRSAGVDVELEWAGNNVAYRAATSAATIGNKPTLYIYNRADNRGFVIIAGKECSNPIVAYSDEAEFDYNNMAPSTRAILDAWSRQIEASTEEEDVAMQAADLAAEGLGNVVSIYDTALWDQSAPYNNECPDINGYRAVTGCVATAMAIVCHYNQWPKKGAGTTPSYSYTDEYEYRNHTIKANTLGRSYDYNNMLHNYSSTNYTTAQGNAVAALMYDMGTSVQMMYHYIASGTFSELVPSAMSTYFSYSKEAVLCRRDGYSAKEWYNILKTNIDKCGPSLYSGIGNEGGHAFVVDGYTDKNYFHFNFGWSGSNNGYYRTPEIDFYEGQDIILNLVPDKDNTSEYTDYLTLTEYQWGSFYFYGIIPYSETIEQGKPFSVLVGCISNDGIATFTGNVAMVLCDKSDNIKEVIDEVGNVKLDPYYLTYAEFADITINSTIEPGDVLRIAYKGSNSDEWQIMRSSSENAVDKILLYDTNIIAKNLMLRYDKNYNNSGKRAIIIGSKVAVDYVCRPSNGGNVIAQGRCNSGEECAVIINSTSSLEMTLELTNGSATHSINITL